MKKINTIFVLGILTVLFPFLGFPGFVKTGAVLIFGIATSIISGIIIIEHKARAQSALSDKQEEEETFIDNKEDFLKKTVEQEQGTFNESSSEPKEQEEENMSIKKDTENKEDSK